MANPDHVRRLARESKTRHLEQRRADNREHYRKNKATYIEQERKRRKENPVRLQAYRANYKAHIKGSAKRISQADYDSLVLESEGLCYWCDTPLGLDAHIDHVVPFKLGGPHSRENIVLACGHCNASKGCKHPADFNHERWEQFRLERAS